MVQRFVFPVHTVLYCRYTYTTSERICTHESSLLWGGCTQALRLQCFYCKQRSRAWAWWH